MCETAKASEKRGDEEKSVKRFKENESRKAENR